jgi:hypothetical protein
MGTSEKQITTPSPAQPLGEDLLSLFSFLVTGQQPTQEAAPTGLGGRLGGLFGGTGRSPVDQTSAVAQGLNRVLTAPDLAPTGTALQEIIQRESGRNIADLRSRFGASGGTSLGTPAAVAESLFRAETGPRIAATLGELGLRGQQLDANKVLSLLQIIASLGARGIPQSRTEVLSKQSPFAEFISTLSGGAQGAASIISAV